MLTFVIRGFVLLSDFAPGPAPCPQRVKKIFRTMDRDEDALLTFQEFVEGSKQDPTIVQVRYLEYAFGLYSTLRRHYHYTMASFDGQRTIMPNLTSFLSFLFYRLNIFPSFDTTRTLSPETATPHPSIPSSHPTPARAHHNPPPT